MKKLLIAFSALVLISACGKKDDGGGSGPAVSGFGENCIEAANCYPARVGKVTNMTGEWEGPANMVENGVPKEGRLIVEITQSTSSITIVIGRRTSLQLDIEGNTLKYRRQTMGTIGESGMTIKDSTGSMAFWIQSPSQMQMNIDYSDTRDGKAYVGSLSAKLTRVGESTEQKPDRRDGDRLLSQELQ